MQAPYDDLGDPKAFFGANEPTSTKFDPAPVFCVPEFFESPARQRAVWFAQ